MLSLAQTIKDLKNNIVNILNTMAPKTYVDKKVADLVNGAPAQLDTLQELSKALNNDKDFGTTVNNAIAKKLDSAGGTITGNLTVNGALTAKASTAGTADRALKADACTGNAATASSVAWSGITNKPTSFTPATHNHDSAYPSTTGARASGTWGINISGKAATAGTADTANNVAWANVTDKPSSLPANGGTSNATNSINITHSNEICLTRNGQTDGGEYWFGYRNDGATKAITAYKFGDGLAKGGLAQITASQFNGNLNGNVAWENVTGKPSTFAPSSHNHDSSYPSTTGTRASGTWGINVTGSAGSVAWDNVTNKPSTFTPSAHNHDSSYPSTTGTRASGTWGINVTGSAGSVAWGNITGKPSTFTPSSHTHAWGQITGAPATATRWPSWGEITGKPASMPANGGTASNAGFLNADAGLTYGNDGLQYFNLSSTSRGTANTNGTPINDWAHIIRMNHGNKTGYYVDLAAGLNSNGLWYRRVTAGSMSGWHTVLDSTNWSNYAPGKTGSGASGTWGINVTGSAGSVAWGNVTGKPSTFTPSSHNHDSAYPSTTGARATGTWGINITGTAAAAGKINIPDTRNINKNPQQCMADSGYALNGDFKSKGTIGIGGTGTYAGLLTFAPWGDASGGYPTQIACDPGNGRMYYRWGTSGTAWSGWKTLAYTDDKPSTAGTADVAKSANAVAWANVSGKPSTFTPSSHNHDSAYPSTTGTRASGTWGINITGNANTSTYPAGFALKRDDASWGAGNKIGRFVTGWVADGDGAPEIAFRTHEGQLNVVIDGQYYANEGECLVLNTGNYNNYAPTKTGGGASGTWGIDISGWAANSIKWNNLIQDTETENNDDTWIPVIAWGKLQHTTKDAMVVGAAKRVSATADNGAMVEAVKINSAGTDFARIAAGGKDDYGWLEIATADNGEEPIYVRQYNGADQAFTKIARTATLLDGSGNTSFPGQVTASSFKGHLYGDADSVGGWTLNSIKRSYGGRTKPSLTSILKKTNSHTNGNNGITFQIGEDINLTQAYTNFDTILFQFTDSEGWISSFLSLPSWQLQFMLENTYSCSLLTRDKVGSWRIWGKKSARDGKPQSTTTLLRLNFTDCAIVDVWGINY